MNAASSEPFRETAAQINVATLTGLVDLAAPDLTRITPRAIAHALARQNRWAGNTVFPINTAQHSVLVMNLFIANNAALRAFAIHALLHDAHEYLIGDITTPAIRALSARLPGADRHLDALKLELDVAIRAALGVPQPSIDIQAAIHEADRFAAAIEWLSGIDASNGPCPYPAPPRGINRLKPLSWPDAEDKFLEALDRELGLKPWELHDA